MGILLILGKHQYSKRTQVGRNIICQSEFFLQYSLLTFEDRYPDILKEDNLSGILSHLMAKQQGEDTEPGQGMTMVL